MSDDEVTIPKLDKPQYKSYAANTDALHLNGGSAKPVVINSIEDIAEKKQENAEDLGEFIATVCQDAVERATIDSLNEINEKIKAFQDASLKYVNQIETVANLKEEARCTLVDVAKRELALGMAAANQNIPLRTLLAGSLVTASLVWLYTIFDPQVTRILAAGVCSLLMLGPIVALYWRKG